MRIDYHDYYSRTLIKDNNEEVNINNGSILEYSGIYYKTINDIVRLAEVQTKFIGIVTTYRSLYGVVTGIYIDPLYIWNQVKNEWHKITNYKPPKTKYFLYPHLLVLSPIDNCSTGTEYKPLYFLDTVINRNLDDFSHITNTFSLEEIE